MGTILSVMLTTFAICSNGESNGEGQNSELRERREALFREATAIVEMMRESEEDARRLPIGKRTTGNKAAMTAGAKYHSNPVTQQNKGATKGSGSGCCVVM